jgi:hypothetical protein
MKDLGHKIHSLGLQQQVPKKPKNQTQKKEPEFQNSEYEVHQVGPKDAGSRNFSFLAFKRERL